MKTNSHEPSHPCPEGPNGFKGLTKREHFAATIMSGLLSQGGWDTIQDAADYAVKGADALLNSLNK